jgi:hypothetical protein
MATPPINHLKQPLLALAVQFPSMDDKKEIINNEMIQQTARQAMLPQVASSKPEAKGGWWSWLWGTGKQEEPKVQEEVSAREEEKEGEASFASGDEDLGASLRGWSDLSSNESDLSSDEMEKEPLVVKESSTEPAKKKEKVEETIVKTYKAAQVTSWESWKGRLGSFAAWAAAPGVRTYANSYKGGVDKESAIHAAKQEMWNQLHDPQFLEFYDVMKAVLTPSIKDLLDSFAGDPDSVAAQYLLPNRPLIIDLLEINLARGFANLARLVKQNQAKIPNYYQQPTLVNILSLFSQKAGAHINRKQLGDLEEKYRYARKALHDQTQQLFPGIDQQPDMKENVQKYIQEYIKSTDANRKNDIKHALFSAIDSISGQKAKDIDSFFATLEILHTRDQEFHKLFALITDDILLYLFPNKFADMEAPGLLQYGWIQDWIYNSFVKDPLASFLQESFEALENDFARNKVWEDELQERVGAPDLQTIIQASSSFLGAFAKNYIQADPNAMKLVAQSIDSLIHPIPDMNASTEEQVLLNQLSQEQLASWIVESAQAMLNTQDSNLEGLGKFIKQSVNNLALALMAKGVKLVVPEDKKITPHAFVKEFADRLIEKFSSLQEKKMDEKFWEDFLEDFPLPAFIKGLLVPRLVKHIKNLQMQLKEESHNFQDIQKIHAETERKIRSYEGGEQLLSITEKISDQIIEQVFKKNIGLITTLGLGDTIEELFVQYLPEVKFNDDLKNWFKKNVSALGAAEAGQSPQSIILLKQSIQAVLRRAMVNTIEKNFKNNSKDYAAQLLQNFHQAFAQAFAGFNAEQRKEIDQALKLQAEIAEKNASIAHIKQKMANQPVGLEANQTALLEAVLNAHIRYIRASNYIDSLIEKRNELLDKLAGWTFKQLSLANEALMLRNLEAPGYTTQDDFIKALHSKIEEYKVSAQNKELTHDEKNDLAKRQLLIAILEMSSDELKQLSDAIHTEATIQHAKKELLYLQGELEAKKNAIVRFDQNKVKDAKAWDDAKEWLTQVLRSRQEINCLSQKVANLEKDLDNHLGTFQVLAEELTRLLGLDEKEKLDLPPFLQDSVWPYIQSAKKSHIARLLFAQISPLLFSIDNIQKNQDKLNLIAQGDTFLGQLIHAGAEEAISRIPEFVTSYKPFARQILMIMGVDQPTEAEIVRMETALNQTLIALGQGGKANLKSKDLLDAYQSQVQGNQVAIPADREESVLHNLQSNGVVEKIKAVVITPEEIAQALNDVIPGATDLHKLIAPQLQAVIAGDDAAFKENRALLQLYLEGALLQLFVKIAEANQSQAALIVITQKLKDLAQGAKLVPGQRTEDVVHQMIDQVLDDVLGIASVQDLNSIPPILRKIAYGKIKEQAYQQLTPLILPIIEREQSRAELQDKSGSNFLGSLCQALSKDLFALLPVSVKSYRPIAEELFALLSDQLPTDGQIDDFAKEIADLVKRENVKNSSLIQAYAKVANQTLELIDQEVLKAKLEGCKAKDNINNIKITPEEIATSISRFFPHLDAKLQQALANELQGLIHNSPAVYQNVADFAGAYIEGVLLKLFIGIAKRSPQAAGKDTLIVLTAKLLDVTTGKYQEMKDGKAVAEVVKELNDAILKDILGIDSPDAFEGLPDALKEKAYDTIKDHLGDLLLRIHQSLSTVESSNTQVQAAKEKVKQKEFGIAEGAVKGYAQILAEDIANMVMTSVPHVLTKIREEKMSGVITISKGIESSLEELSRGNIGIAKVLLNYTQGDQFQNMLGDNLAKLADKENLVEDKQKAAELLSNLLLVPLSQVIEKAIQFENKKGEQFNQQLMANLLKVGAEHLRHLNAAKELAAQKGQTDIQHQDFVQSAQAAGNQLHPGVPKEPVAYQKSIRAITKKLYGNLTPEQAGRWQQEQSNVRKLMASMVKAENRGAKVITLDDFIEKFEEIHSRVMGDDQLMLTLDQKNALKARNGKGLTLRDLIRHEAEAPIVQRQKEAYGPAIKEMMKLLFPNGKDDLTFVPAELRGIVWQTFKKNLFPVVLPMLTEVLLDPAMVNTIVLNSLATLKDSLSAEIVLDPNPEPADRPLDDLDRASGELIFEVLKAATLPAWMKNLMLDSEQKGTSDTMKRTLGATLRKQFNNTFIQDYLKLALEKAIARINPETGEFDAAGQPRLSFDTRPEAIQKQEAAANAKQMQVDLKRVSRELVDVSISYFIDSKWTAAQAHFDKLVEKAFGKIGFNFKKALDAVFRFIFFRVIGTILSVLFWPAKQLVKQAIYRLISLDNNRDALLRMLTHVPTDQPVIGTGISHRHYPVYNEDVIFKMGKVLHQTVQEFLEEAPVLHVPSQEDLV